MSDVQAEVSGRAPRVLTGSSFASWFLGVVVLAYTVWADNNRSGGSGDVAAGMAGIAFVFGAIFFVLFATAGIVLGVIATRRDPANRAADVALGLNVVTLGGMLISGLILVIR